MQQLILDSLRWSDLAQAMLSLQSRPYSLERYPMFEDIFNSTAQRRLMRAGRQVSKTTMIAADMVTRAVSRPFLQAIYCNSSREQTLNFSISKLSPFLMQSRTVWDYVMHKQDSRDDLTRTRLTKKLRNNSELLLSYFADSADRVRGKSGQCLYLDEVQDMLWDAMIDAEECLSAAPDPRYTYAGTSKSMNTPLEFLWKESTQKEWLIPCEGCGARNRPSLENIGKKGLICKKCGKPLDTFRGSWHAFNPPTESYEPFVDGFWIPQIIMPLHCTSPEKWSQLLKKRDVYSAEKFNNEVMGLPSSDGDSPITEDMLRAACDENQAMLDHVCRENADGARCIAAGIDWGGGGDLGVSRTVLSIYACWPEQPLYRKIFGRIYDDGEPANHVEDIAMWLVRFGAHMVCGDHGGGNFAMSMLASKIPPHMRLVPVMYSDSGRPLKWDDAANRYVVNRTAIIDAFFLDLSEGRVRTFRWSEFEPFARDILNIRQEVIGEDRGQARRVWRHGPRNPDDALHSMVFGWLGCRVLGGRADFRIAG